MCCCVHRYLQTKDHLSPSRLRLLMVCFVESLTIRDISGHSEQEGELKTKLPPSTTLYFATSAITDINVIITTLE